MILQPGPDARAHFFLIGLRAPLGSQGPLAEQVGVLVARDVIRFDGSAADSGEVLKIDQPYAGLPAAGPFRYESEIAPYKPEPDVVVVDDLDRLLTPTQLADTANLDVHIAAASFGTLEVDRGSGFGPALPLHFGWRSRTAAPRLALAGREGAPGDPSSLAGFDPEQFDLPDQFDNAFHNGRPLAGAQHFAPGHRLRFTDTTGPAVATTVVVPAAPPLVATQDGRPLDPPLTLQPRIDTVVMDRGSAQFTLVWRASFAWEPRFEAAMLAVD